MYKIEIMIYLGYNKWSTNVAESLKSLNTLNESNDSNECKGYDWLWQGEKEAEYKKFLESFGDVEPTLPEFETQLKVC